MKNINNEFLKELKEERTTYKDMIDFCCDSLILNNDIIGELSKCIMNRWACICYVSLTGALLGIMFQAIGRTRRRSKLRPFRVLFYTRIRESRQGVKSNLKVL